MSVLCVANRGTSICVSSPFCETKRLNFDEFRSLKRIKIAINKPKQRINWEIIFTKEQCFDNKKLCFNTIKKLEGALR